MRRSCQVHLTHTSYAAVKSGRIGAVYSQSILQAGARKAIKTPLFHRQFDCSLYITTPERSTTSPSRAAASSTHRRTAGSIGACLRCAATIEGGDDHLQPRHRPAQICLSRPGIGRDYECARDQRRRGRIASYGWIPSGATIPRTSSRRDRQNSRWPSAKRTWVIPVASSSVRS